MGQRDQTGSLVEQRIELVQLQLAARCHGQDGEIDSFRVAQQLPGNDVGVMFHGRKHDPVARTPDASEPVRHEVDRLRCAAQEDNLAGRVRVQESTHSLARALVGIGRPLRQCVDRAMDIGVVSSVETGDCLDDALGFLRGGGVIQVGERQSSHLLVKTREVSADRFQVPGRDLGQANRLQRCVHDASPIRLRGSFAAFFTVHALRFRSVEGGASARLSRLTLSNEIRTAALITGQ
jgi:hypothetical protein